MTTQGPQWPPEAFAQRRGWRIVRTEFYGRKYCNWLHLEYFNADGRWQVAASGSAQYLFQAMRNPIGRAPILTKGMAA